MESEASDPSGSSSLSVEGRGERVTVMGGGHKVVGGDEIFAFNFGCEPLAQQASDT
ncbi:hypothetical protein [Limimaricola litoreus]|uniref:hypothetical protein n=1 Tax=Limimaricola litoreus TaxID=2955316 RepID=UPI00209F0B72|nr:hypothetical protein [Limimaricola litoreus]